MENTYDLLEWLTGCGQASPVMAAYQKKVQDSSNFSGHNADVSAGLQYILEAWRSRLYWRNGLASESGSKQVERQLASFFRVLCMAKIKGESSHLKDPFKSGSSYFKWLN